MDANDVLALGLGVTPPWKLVGQRLDGSTQPNQLHLEVAAERGALFPCPTCGKLCKAHDFAEFTWRHLNFFQHHCYVTAKVPRTDCPEDGVLRINVGSRKIHGRLGWPEAPRRDSLGSAG
jgi:transposase